jgi:hypothetical protein
LRFYAARPWSARIFANKPRAVFRKPLWREDLAYSLRGKRIPRVRYGIEGDLAAVIPKISLPIAAAGLPYKGITAKI